MINEKLKKKFARSLFAIGGFKDVTRSPEGKGFRLKLHELNPEAPLSPFYIDLRLLQSDYDAKRMAVSLLAQMVDDLSEVPDRLGAIPESIVAVVSSLSDTLRIPMITPRAAKGHGSGAKIDGIWELGQTVVLFDDVVTKADSKLEAAKTVRTAGLQVSDVLVLVDRQQGGYDQLAAEGLKLHAAFVLDELLDIYRNEGLMSEKVFRQIAEYRGLSV